MERQTKGGVFAGARKELKWKQAKRGKQQPLSGLGKRRRGGGDTQC